MTPARWSPAVVSLLLDQGLDARAAGMLTALGIDAVHVVSLGLSDASDEDILAVALHQQRVVVTLDADFHRMLVLTAASGPSVIRLRLEGLKADGLVRVLRSVVGQMRDLLLAGAMVTVTERSIRATRLGRRSGE